MAALGSCYSDQMSLVTLVFTEVLETFSMLIGIVSQTQALDKCSLEPMWC